MNKKYFCIIFLFWALYFIPGPKYQIYDLTNNNQITTEFSIQQPVSDIIFAPFVDIADYFLRFEKYRIQIFSWFCWFLIFGIFLFLFKKKSINIILKSFTLFWILVIFVLFFPYSGNHIISTNPNKILVNYHSHTKYSWDGMASFKRSVNYHKKNGYHAYAITEHNLVLSKNKNIDISYFENQQMPVIFGEEIRDHIFLLVYDDVKIGALWWQHSNFEDVSKKPIIGYEISNMGYRNPDTYNQTEIQKSIEFAKMNNLTMIGSTDWHGWGFKSNTWTAVEISGWQNMNYKEKQTAILDALIGKYKTSVLVYTRNNELKTNLRYIFEPFFGLFYLLSAKNFWGLFSWFVWLIFLIYFFNKFDNCFFILTGIIIVWSALKLYLTWMEIANYNHVLNKIAIYLIIVGILSFWTGIFKKAQRFKGLRTSA